MALAHQPQAASLIDVVTLAEARGAGRGHPEVIALYRDWIAAQPPGAANLHVAWFNYGSELSAAGALTEAMQAYQQALLARPDFSGAAVNLGLLLERRGDIPAALQAWNDALQPDNSRTTLLNHHGRLLEQSGQLAAASESMRRSLLTNPAQPDTVQHWLHLRQKMCEWPVLAETIPGLTRRDMILQSGPLAALALTDDVVSQRMIAGNWIARKVPQVGVRLAPPEGYDHDRIRVGYLSSDFCSHAMSYLIAELFERHDRSAFEIYGYCMSPEDGSPIRARVIAAFDHFQRIHALSDEDAARRIRQDEIDILVDLNGLTAGSRLGIIRWRPAPVQATYLGFIGPVPLPELDYVMCDPFVVPPAVAEAYQPKPLYIAELYQANDSKRAIGEPLTRAQVGLPEGRFVFCNFSNHYKITEAMFSAWLQILAQCPDALLWLAEDNAWSRNNLMQAALAAGVHPARLVFAPRVGPEMYMARIALADLFLDTFPYNAGTVASDVIRMGVPLLTLAGQSFASRMAARLLKAIGAEAGIATSQENYVARAVALATDRESYTTYRGCFTQEAWAGSIGDIEGFTRQYEATLRRVCQRPAMVLQAAE